MQSSRAPSSESSPVFACVFDGLLRTFGGRDGWRYPGLDFGRRQFWRSRASVAGRWFLRGRFRLYGGWGRLLRRWLLRGPLDSHPLLHRLFLAAAFFRAGTTFFFAVRDETCALTASFTRTTAAFKSSSTSLTWSAPFESRRITSEVSSSILAIRLRVLFAFMTIRFSQRLAMVPNDNRQNNVVALQAK